MQFLRTLPPPAYAVVLGLIGVVGTWLGGLLFSYDPGATDYVLSFVILAVLGWTLARRRQTEST